MKGDETIKVGIELVTGTILFFNVTPGQWKYMKGNFHLGIKEEIEGYCINYKHVTHMYEAQKYSWEVE